MTYHAKVIAGGKIVIPAELRREFGIKDGDSLVLQRDASGGLSVKTFDQVVKETRSAKRFGAIFGAGYTVDQFLSLKIAPTGARE